MMTFDFRPMYYLLYAFWKTILHLRENCNSVFQFSFAAGFTDITRECAPIILKAKSVGKPLANVAKDTPISSDHRSELQYISNMAISFVLCHIFSIHFIQCS